MRERGLEGNGTVRSAAGCCERSCGGCEMTLGCSRCLQSPLSVLFFSEVFGRDISSPHPRLWVSPSSAVGSLHWAELWSQARVLLRSPRCQGGHHHPARPDPAAGRAALLPCGRGEDLLRDPAQSHDPQPRGECPVSLCPQPCQAARTAPVPVPALPAWPWRGSDSPGCWLGSCRTWKCRI